MSRNRSLQPGDRFFIGTGKDRDSKVRIIGQRKSGMFRDDQSYPRMAVLLAALDLGKDVKTWPPIRKFRAHCIETFYELQKMQIARVASIVETKSRDYILRAGFPIHHEGAQLWMGKDEPDKVSFFGRNPLEIEKKRSRAAIPGKDVPPTPPHKGGHAAQLIEYLLDRRANALMLDVGVDNWLTHRKLEKLDAFGRLELQHTRKIVQGARRNADRPLLFEPGVPGGADTGQLRHFLPP